MSETKLSKAIDIMIKTDHMHKALIDSRMSTLGIHRTQHRILMLLSRLDKLPSQKDLAEHLHITPAAVTIAIKKIEKDGYVVRTLGHDNRFNELSITDTGRALVEQTKQIFCEADRSIFEGLSDEELDTYISCLEKLQANMRKQYERRESNEKMV